MNLFHRFAVFGKFGRHSVDAGRVVEEVTCSSTRKTTAIADDALLRTRTAWIFCFWISRARRRRRALVVTHCTHLNRRWRLCKHVIGAVFVTSVVFVVDVVIGVVFGFDVVLLESLSVFRGFLGYTSVHALYTVEVNIARHLGSKFFQIYVRMRSF